VVDASRAQRHAVVEGLKPPGRFWRLAVGVVDGPVSPLAFDVVGAPGGADVVDPFEERGRLALAEAVDVAVGGVDEEPQLGTADDGGLVQVGEDVGGEQDRVVDDDVADGPWIRWVSGRSRLVSGSRYCPTLGCTQAVSAWRLACPRSVRISCRMSVGWVRTRDGPGSVMCHSRC
jgi:hypothetical protein